MRKVAFTQEDDALLMKYIATYNPKPKGRLGMKLYERLVENAERKWSFSLRHTVQAWRERYKNNQPWFDAQILKYQKKHGIPADDESSHSTVQSGVRTTPPVSSGSRTNTPGCSTAPVGENGVKKRRREADSEDTNLHSGAVKKMRREKVSVQGSNPCDSPPHTRSPSPSAASARLSPPFSPADNVEANPSLAQRRSSSPCPVGTTVAHGELSPSHQQHDSSFRVADAEASGYVRKSVGAPPQPSQEPTPPHTSAINSPRSPLQRQPLSTNGASSHPGSSHMSSISQKHKRISPPQRKRTVAPRHGDDIFSTPPPPQVVRPSPPLRTSGREAPHLVEGPFRSAYTNANEHVRPMLRGRSLSGTDEEAEADGEDEEWPPRRGKRESLVLSEGLNSTLPRGREQPIAKVQPQRPPSSGLYAPGAAPVDKSGHPSVNDPFKVPLVNREARRWTLADDSKIPRVDACREDLVRRASVQHIDLRALHSVKSVGTSLIGSAMSVGRSGTSESGSVAKKGPRRPSRSSTIPNLSESNKELVLDLGLKAVFSRMVENHKFHIDIVREVAAGRTLEDTDRVLRNMYEAAIREYVRSRKQDETVYSPSGCETGESEYEDKDDVIKPGDGEDDSQPVRLSPASLSSYHSPMLLVPQGRAKRLALKITTASPDSSPTRPSEYSPPTPTRARAFLRLERQGRKEEARLREAHRVRRSLRPNGAEASPEAVEQLQESDARDNASPGPLDSSLDDVAEVEEQVHGDGDCQTLSELQAISPEAELHVVSTGVDDGVAANGRPTPSVLTEKIKHNGFPLERGYAAKETSSLACSPLATLSVLDAEWTNSDDELLLDGDLIVHEELVRRKGLGSVKFRTAHLYSLLLDG